MQNTEFQVNYPWIYDFTLVFVTSYDYELSSPSKKFYDKYDLSSIILCKTSMNNCEFSHLSMDL